MRRGIGLAAGLLLTAAAGATFALPADVHPMNQPVFEIPIRKDGDKLALIRNLELYVSTNEGANWDLVGSATPDKESFRFEAKSDGMHWFYVMTYDQQGRKEPRVLNRETVQQKILIDTLRPDVRLKSAVRKNDAVLVDWEIKEENPDLTSLKLEYKADGTDWVNVPVAQNLAGQATIQTAAGVVVRLSMKDAADNAGRAEAAVSGASGIRTVGAVVPVAVGAGATPAPVGGLPAVLPAAVPDVPAGVPATIGNTGAEAAVTTTPVKPVATSSEPVKRSSTAVTPKLPGPPGIDDLGPPPVDTVKPIQPPPGLNDPLPGIGSVPSGIAATAPTPSAPAVAPGVPPTGDRPAVQPVNNPRVTLEYEVAKYGPSGIGAVDLYITRDDGMTWQPIAAEHGTPLSTPGTPTDLKNAGSLRRTVSVKLTEDGAYGFYMVVKSGAGLGRGAPRAPEAPQIRIELDTVQPVAKLFKPEANANQRDALVIAWEATDKNLAVNPITIQWAEQKNGPWEYIGGPQLPNTGSYSWQPPTSIPYKVYMRLTVRDAAGNAAVAETANPVDVDLTMPEYRLIGVVKDRN